MFEWIVIIVCVLMPVLGIFFVFELYFSGTSETSPAPCDNCGRVNSKHRRTCKDCGADLDYAGRMADVPSLSKRFPTTSRHFLKGLGAIAIGIGALYAIVSLLALTINWADSALHPFREHEAKYEQICRQVIAEADTLSGDETIPEKGLIIVDGMSGEVSSRVTGDSLGNRAPDRARSPERVRFIACRWEHPIQIGDYGAACPALRVSMSYDLVDLRTGNVLDEKRFEGTRPIDAIPAPLNPSKCRQYGRGLPESGPIVDWLQEAMANR